MNALLSLVLAAVALLPGVKSPDVTLHLTSGKDVKLSSLWAQGPVILAFFPKAFTGG